MKTGASPRRAYGTTELARICQVTPPTIGRWIEEGKLPAFSTGGGHRRVWSEDVVAFLRAHNIPVPPELDGRQRVKVLIVDDEADIRHLIARVVRRLYPDAEIHQAADGFEAGQKLALVVPAIVILDLKLPGIDGIKVCRSIRAQPSMNSVKILAVSGYNVASAAKECRDAGADDFLGKPFDWKELEKRIETLLGVRQGYAKTY